MPMPAASDTLQQPLDAMYLIHKALRAEALRVEEAVSHLEVGGSFKPFHRIFYPWALALSTHLEAEEKYLTPLVPVTCQAATPGGGLAHVMAQLEGLQAYLHEDLGRTMVIPRTQRQLRGKVIALHLLQEDLLEAEEDVVLPHLRQHLSEAEQRALMQHLLYDEAAEAGALLDWVAQAASATEQAWLMMLGACGTIH